MGPSSAQSPFLTEVKLFSWLISQQILLISIQKWFPFYPRQTSVIWALIGKGVRSFWWAQFSLSPQPPLFFCVCLKCELQEIIACHKVLSEESQLSSALDSLSSGILRSPRLLFQFVIEHVSSLFHPITSIYLHYYLCHLSELAPYKLKVPSCVWSWVQKYSVSICLLQHLDFFKYF